MIKSSPQKIIAEGTDWRFLNELKRELKVYAGAARVPRPPSLHHVTGAVHSAVVIVWMGCGRRLPLPRRCLDAPGERQ
jgi:hypothetical protein